MMPRAKPKQLLATTDRLPQSESDTRSSRLHDSIASRRARMVGAGAFFPVRRKRIAGPCFCRGIWRHGRRSSVVGSGNGFDGIRS